MPTLELPAYGKHIVLAGSTGSGKSYMAEKMIKHYDSYFAIDTQDSLAIPGHTLKTPGNLAMYLSWFKQLHYTPRPEYLHRDAFNYVFKTLLNSTTKKKPRPRICYIDEIYHVGYGTNFPAWLPKAITTARQRQLSFWIATQRPRQIPIPILSEASKIYVFYLAKLDDAKLIASFARENPKELFSVLANQQDDYSFVEIDCRKGSWQLFPPLKV